jgi:hypothetical protein
MGVDMFVRRGLTGVSIVLGGMVLAGCGGQAGSVAAGDSTPVSTKIGNLLAFNSPNAPPTAASRPSVQAIDCPVVQIEPGASAVRIGGEAASSVRYQISIGDVARECALVGGQLQVRVGVETRTVVGPAGSAGTYTAPLRVMLRKVAGEQTIASKTYRVGGAVGSTGTAINSLIADPLTAPYINERASDDYEVVLALGQGESEPGAARRKRR